MRKKRSTPDEGITVNRPKGYTCGHTSDRQKILTSDDLSGLDDFFAVTKSNIEIPEVRNLTSRVRRESILPPSNSTQEELHRQMRQYSRNRYSSRTSHSRTRARYRNDPRWECGNKFRYNIIKSYS